MDKSGYWSTGLVSLVLLMLFFKDIICCFPFFFKLISKVIEILKSYVSIRSYFTTTVVARVHAGWMTRLNHTKLIFALIRCASAPPTKKRKMITDEVSLRVPLMYGWRRETTMRTITQSGVRGEVIYYAPCGKPFRQYPDIMRVMFLLYVPVRSV